MATADPEKKKKKRKKKESLEHKRNRILVALGIFAVVYVLDELGTLTAAFGTPGDIYASFVLFLVPFLIAGYDVLQKAFNNIRRGKAFDESFLMAVATIGAFAMVLFPDTDPHMAEGAAVMLFYQVGELFQAYAVGKSRKSISAMMDIAPDYANVEQPDGTLEQVFPDDIAVGTVIVVKPGERVPIDGVIVEGETQLDTAALTGESVPRPAKTGDDIISGCINMTGLIHVRTTKPFGESTVARVLELVENASEKKARTENFITRFARIYTPAVTGAAAVLALGGGLVTGAWSDWILRGLTFLVVSCPCALVISVPLSFFGGIGGASKLGVLIKGSNYLETLADVDTVVFDKTGTLTNGTFSVVAVHPEAGYTEQSLLEVAALAESFSDHPIAQSVRVAYQGEVDPKRVSDSTNDAGHGVTATIDGKHVVVGNAKMLAAAGVEAPDCEVIGTILHVLVDGVYAGHIVIADTVKADAEQTIRDLHAAGVKRTVMLTGDRADVAAAARAIAELKVQPRPVSLAYEASPVMDIILGAAKEGASLYAVTDPAGITHRVWEVKREDAVAAIRAMLDQVPEPALADDPAYAAALAGASQLLADEARAAGTYTGKEPFNFAVAALFPAAQVSGGAPQVPTGLLTHQVARF